MILTGTTAAFLFNGTRVGKCRQINLQIERDALPTTKQGDLDLTFVSGLRNTKGSASLFYDPSDEGVKALLLQVYSDSTTLPGFELIFDSPVGQLVSAAGILTNTSLSASYGEAQVAEIQFQVSGKPTEVL